MKSWMPKQLFCVLFTLLLLILICSSTAIRQDLSSMRNKNYGFNYMNNFFSFKNRASRPIISIQNNLNSANENFIADKINSNYQTSTESKDVYFELDKNRITKSLDAQSQDQDLTYFINEPAHTVPAGVYEAPAIARVAYKGAPAHGEQVAVYSAQIATPHAVHAPVMASPQAVHYVPVAETPSPVHIVAAPTPAPTVTVTPVILSPPHHSEEKYTTEEVKEIVHEELVHNLRCHPEEPTYLHDVNLNLCPCNQEKAAAPIMFAEAAEELKERGGFPWWLLLLILLGLFLIALLLCLTIRKKEAIQPVKPLKNFVIEKKTNEHDEEEIEREIQSQLQARQGARNMNEIKKQEPVPLSAEPKLTLRL